MPKKPSAPPRTRNVAGRGSDQFPLRLPDGMREQIKAAADENGRSMNQEIIDVLREYFPDPPTDEEILDELQAALTWGQNLDTAGKRHTIHAHLVSFIELLQKRVKKRTDAFVTVERHILDRIDEISNRIDMPRDEVAANLIKMSLIRIQNGSEKFKAVVWPQGSKPTSIEVDIPD